MPKIRDYSNRKNPRASGPKVRSGCRTCKIRHVKCGEEKPDCLKCTNTGRRCDYDPVTQAKVLEYLDTRNVSVTVPGSQQERRQLAFFTACTASNLSGYFDEGFWNRLVLQVSLEIPALRHAVIALASLHETFRDGREERGKQLDGSKSTFAMKQYTKALGHLGKDLKQGKRSDLVTIMICIIFICFDNLGGRFDSALVHLRSGMQIIQAFLNAKPQNSDTHFIRGTLVPLFKRLWFQAVFFYDFETLQSISGTWSDWIHSTMTDVETFSTLQEARNNLSDHLALTLQFFHSAGKQNTAVSNQHASRDEVYRIALSAPLPKTVFPRNPEQATNESNPTQSHQPYANPPLPESALNQHRNLEQALISWSQKFHTYQETHSSASSPYTQESPAAILLELHWTVVDLMIKKVLHRNSSDNRFSEVLSLCRKLINLEQSQSKSDSSNSVTSSSPSMFSADLGLIGILYFIAVRCEIEHLRWDAVNLLHMSKRREGMWDSELTARVCARIIKSSESRCVSDSGLKFSHVDPAAAMREREKEVEDVVLIKKSAWERDSWVGGYFEVEEAGTIGDSNRRGIPVVDRTKGVSNCLGREAETIREKQSVGGLGARMNGMFGGNLEEMWLEEVGSMRIGL